MEPASAQINRTWIGTINSDWYNPTNWTPNGVPATNDIVNFTNGNGTIDLSAPVVIANQFNWEGGTLMSNALTIASNAVLNINGSSTLFLASALTNAGTVIWTNVGPLDVEGGLGYSGQIVNIQSDVSLFDTIAANGAIFQNAGTLQKSAGTGTTYIYIPLVNTGSVTGLEGTVMFSGGGSLAGNFNASAGAAIDFAGGGFTNSVPVSVNGPGTVQLTGGTLTLLTDEIANLPLTGGTVDLGPAFQGGVITNLTIDGATLAGTNKVTGIFNWNNGTISGGPLMIAKNAVMNINGNTTLYLVSALTNAGTVNWTNIGGLDVENGAGSYFGQIINLPGALWNIENDQSMYNNIGTGNTAYFQNAGTLQKSAGTGTTYIYIPLVNSGSVTGLEGTLLFYGGGPLAGTYTANAGAAIDFASGLFTNSVPVSINGPGTVQFTGGTLTLLTDIITNLPLTGGTVDLGPAFQQGGSITNLTIDGATLAGTNTVTGVFNWDNGTIAGGPLTIASNGVLNINGNTTLYLASALTNAGTVNWSGTGSMDVENGVSSYFGIIVNLPGGLWNIENNELLFNNIGTGNTAYFQNAGTLQKSAGTGTTSIYIATTNSGTITSLKGTLAFYGGINLGGGERSGFIGEFKDFGRADVNEAGAAGRVFFDRMGRISRMTWRG